MRKVAEGKPQNHPKVSNNKGRKKELVKAVVVANG